jgi:hypothetical protein
MTRHAWDLMCLAGALAVAGGLWWAWPPAGLVWMGACMMAVGVLASAREERGSGRRKESQS